MPLPDIPTDEWQTYQADTFSMQADQRIDALSFNTAANSRIAQLNQMYAPPPEAPPPSDSLTNPLSMQGPSSAGFEVGIPTTVPSSSTGTAPSLAEPTTVPLAPALPAPDAPLTVPLVAPSNRLPASPPVAPSNPVAQTGDPIADALNAADRYQLDPHLFLGLLNQESGLQHYSAPGVVKTSPAGARGIGQLMPDTARGLGVNPDDPAQNLDGAARYLRQNIDRYGGDVVKALAAYNAGAGNVDKYGGVPPFAETRKYVDSIMSSVASNASPTIVQGPAQTDSVLTPGFSPSEQPGGAKAPINDISQFGNPQLTTDEAYVACGPAAAVRFAQRFGRNPTLREATDLAAQVGWTVKDGMAGLGSEQALMTKMGIPTRMVTPVDANGKPVDVWSVFANEAQTGNPVTISTPGHYFTADGYDTSSGKFHVGRSGLDLRGGSEWMSPAQMQGLMGQVQGGLLADNPQVPAPSTADQSSNPLDWLGRQKDALTSGIQGWFDNLGTAANQTLSSPFAQSVQAGQEAQTRGTVQAAEGVGDTAGRALTAPTMVNGQPVYPDQAKLEQASRLLPQSSGEMAGVALGAPTSGEIATEQRNQAIAQGNPLRDVPVLGGATTFAAQTVLDPTNLLLAGEPGVARAVGRGAGEAGAAISELATAPETQALLRTRQRGEGINPFSLLIPEGTKPNAVEQTLDRGLILPRAESPTGPTQILGPRGELLSTVASREGPPAPGIGVVRSTAGATQLNEPSKAAVARMPNLTKMAVDMPEVQATIQRVAEENPELIDAFRQGKITHQQLVEDMAPRLGITAEDFLKSKVGQAFNPEELVTLRAAVVQKQAQTVQLAQDIADKGGVNALSAEDKVNAISQIVDAARLQAVARGGVSTAARTLNQQKIVITQEMAKAITGGNEAVAAQRALNAAKAKAAWAEAKLAALDKAGGTTSATLRSNLRSEMAQAGRQAGQEVIDAGKPLGAAYDEAVAAAKADLEASNNYLEDAFDNQIKQLEQEAAKRAAKVRGAQGEGDVAWLQAQAKAARAEENAANIRTQRAFDQSMRVRERQQEQAGKILDALGGRKVTDEMLKQFVAVQNSGDPLAAALFLRGMAKTTAWDRIGIIRYGSMLSATATHLTNSLGNTIQLGLDVGLKPLSVGVDVARAGVTGGQRTRYMGELPHQVRGMLDGTIAGARDALVVMRTGINPQTAGKLEQIRGGFNMADTVIGRAIGQRASTVVDVAAEAPLRALSAADLIFRGAARGGQTRALAMRRAIQEGYTGTMANARTEQIMQNLVDYPTLLEEAEKGAARVVLQESRAEIRGLAQRTQGPAGVVQSIFLPFVRTPYNIAAQGEGMTPAGFAGALKSAAEGNHGEAADRAARAIFGTAVMGVAGGLGMAGYLTGGYPKDESARSTLPPGWKPWSVRIPSRDGATYVSYQNLGPIGVPMAIAAVMTEAARQGQPFDPTRVVTGVGSFMIDQTFLQGLNAVIQAIQEPDRYAENLSEGIASSFVPYGALQRQIERSVGMADRDPHGAIQALLATSPLTAGAVQPRTDAQGRPIQQGQTGIAAFASPFRYDIERDTPVLQALRTADVGIPAMPKKVSVRGGEIPLTQDEQAQLKAQRGQKIDEIVGYDITTPSFKALNTIGQQRRLRQLVERATSQIDNAFINAIPADQFEQRKSAKAPVPYVVSR